MDPRPPSATTADRWATDADRWLPTADRRRRRTTDDSNDDGRSRRHSSARLDAVRGTGRDSVPEKSRGRPRWPHIAQIRKGR
eukprot:8934805-Pyramimonas_sp.AAC.1